MLTVTNNSTLALPILNLRQQSFMGEWRLRYIPPVVQGAISLHFLDFWVQY